MPGCSLTEAYVKIFKHYLEGNKDKAYVIYFDLVSLLNFIFQSVEVIIRSEKVILYRRGIIDSPYCRAESYQLDKYFNKQLTTICRELKSILTNINIIF